MSISSSSLPKDQAAQAVAKGRHTPTGMLLRRLLGTYLLPYKKRLVAALVFMALSALLTALFAKMLEPVLDEVLVGGRQHLIVPMAVSVFVIFTLNGLTTYLHNVLLNTMGQAIVADLQSDLFSRLIALDLGFFQHNASGGLVARMISDVNVLRGAVSDIITGIGKSLLTLILLTVVMFMQDWRLALIAFCIFPPTALCVSIIGRRLRKLSRSIQNEIGDMSSYMLQIFQGVRQVKAYGMEAYESARGRDSANRVKKLAHKGVRVSNLSSFINEALIGLALMGVVMYGGFQVADGTLTVGALMSFIGAFALSLEPIRRLAKLNTTLQMALGAGERVLEMLDMRPNIVDRPGAVALSAPMPALRFDNVSFSYEGGEARALNNVSFDAQAGKVTALVGPSGGGKSTVMNLIPRLYEASEGRVLIDGTDVRDVTQESLRAHIALVSQDITIFDDSVFANIAYGRKDASEHDVIEAARAAAADQFIRDLPDGYQTRLGEDGTILSGGQRQRLAIARAILRDAPILLLDEATSALDNESERLIQESLTRLQQGRTSIVIAHRLSTVRDADRIIVLDRGHVAEDGTHDVLIARGGLYAHLYNLGLKS